MLKRDVSFPESEHSHLKKENPMQSIDEDAESVIKTKEQQSPEPYKDVEVSASHEKISFSREENDNETDKKKDRVHSAVVIKNMKEN